MEYLPSQIQLGFFCSVKCPPSLILKAYDLAQAIVDAEISVISGFHSPAEKEMLITLLRGKQNIVICPARSIDKMRIPSDWKPYIEAGRLSIVSPFPKYQTRATEQTAIIRNQFVASLAENIFVAYASPKGKTELFCKEVLNTGKPLYTFDGPFTQNIRDLGGKIINLEALQGK